MALGPMRGERELRSTIFIGAESTLYRFNNLDSEFLVPSVRSGCYSSVYFSSCHKAQFDIGVNVFRGGATERKGRRIETNKRMYKI